MFGYLLKICRILPLAVSLTFVFGISGCYGTFESLNPKASIEFKFFGVSGIRRDQTGGFTVFWKNPNKLESPRMLLYYMKLENGVEDIPNSTEALDLSETLSLPAKLYTVNGEISPETYGELVTEVADGTESTPLRFNLDPTKHHAFQIRAVLPDGNLDNNQTVLVLAPTADVFPGCIEAAGLDEKTIKLEYEFPPDSTNMTIFRNGIAIKVVEPAGSRRGSYLDEGLQADTEYKYTCEAKFVDDAIMGSQTVTAKTIDPTAGIDFNGCVDAVPVSGSIIRVSFEFPENVDRVSVYESGVKRYTSGSPKDTIFDHTNLQEGITYFYQCQAEDQGLTIIGQNEVSARTVVSNPPNFAGIDTLAYKPDGDHVTATLSWKPATGVPSLKYLVFHGPGQSVDWESEPIEVPTTSFTYDIKGLGDDLHYSFGVRACSDDEICDSNTVTITRETPDTGPPKTKGIKEIELKNGVVYLTVPWQPADGGVVTRRIYVLLAGPGKDKNDLSDYKNELSPPVWDELEVPTSLQFPSLEENTTYHFIVRDEDQHGNENTNMATFSVTTGDLDAPNFSGISTLKRKVGEEDRTLEYTFETIRTEAEALQAAWNAHLAANAGASYAVFESTYDYKEGAKEYIVLMSDPVPLPPTGDPIPLPQGDPCLDGTVIQTIPNNVGPTKDPNVTVTGYIENLEPRTQYFVCILAVDEAGNISDATSNASTYTIDITPPANFEGIQKITYLGETKSLKIDWNPSSAVDIQEYHVRLWKRNENAARKSVSYTRTGGDVRIVTGSTQNTQHNFSAGDRLLIENAGVELARGNYTVSSVVDPWTFEVSAPGNTVTVPRNLDYVPIYDEQMFEISHATNPNSVTISNYGIDSEESISAKVDACDNTAEISASINRQNCTNTTLEKNIRLPDIRAPQGFIGIAATDDLKTSKDAPLTTAERTALGVSPSRVLQEGEVLVKWAVQPEGWATKDYRGFRVYSVEDGALQSLADCPCQNTTCVDDSNPSADKRTMCIVSGLDPYREYTLHVRAYDASGNITQTPYISFSNETTTVVAKIAKKRTSDETKPVFNSALQLNLSGDIVNLSWSPAQDNQSDPTALVRYQVWRLELAKLPNNTYPAMNPILSPIENSTGWTMFTSVGPDLSYADNTVDPNKRYHYTVCAIDASWTNVAHVNNRTCDGALRTIDLADIKPPIVSEFESSKTGLATTWSMSWRMEDYAPLNETNGTPVTANLFRNETLGGPREFTLADYANPSFEFIQVGSTQTGTNSSDGGQSEDFTMTDVGPGNKAVWLNYLLVVEDAAGNVATANLSLYSDTEVSIAAITPAQGRQSGGNLIVIEGKGFQQNGISVRIGGKECTNINVFIAGKQPLPATATQDEGAMLTCVTPDFESSSGPQNIEVTQSASTAAEDGAFLVCIPGGSPACTNPCDDNYDSVSTAPFLDRNGDNISDGDGSVGSPFEICTAEHWAAINNQVSGRRYELLTNIDLSSLYDSDTPADSLSINKNETNLSAYNIDGNGYIIANYTAPPTGDYAGLIDRIGNSSVTNLGVINVNVNHPTGIAGGFAGDSTSTTYENVYVVGCNVAGTRSGGIVGQSLNDHFINVESHCAVNGTQSSGGVAGDARLTQAANVVRFNGTVQSGPSSLAGGIFGYLEGRTSLIIRQANVTATIDSGANGGGIVGRATEATLKVVDSHVSGSITGVNSVGGIVGTTDVMNTDGFMINNGVTADVYSTSTGKAGGFIGEIKQSGGINKVDIINNYYSGTVDAGSASTAGGLIGSYSSSNLNILNTKTFGQVSAAGRVGGLVGDVNISDGISKIYVSRSASAADVDSTGSFAGGLVGWDSTNRTDDSVPDYEEVFATGDVTSTGASAGGLFGETKHEILNAYARGDVTGSTRVGGFAGRFNGTFGMSNGYAVGNVSGPIGDTGGFVGSIFNTNAFTNNYWDSVSTGLAGSAGAEVGKIEGKVTTAMVLQNTYANFDFGNPGVWKIAEGQYPTFQWESQAWVTGIVEKACSTTQGTKTLRIFVMNPHPSQTLQIKFNGITITDSNPIPSQRGSIAAATAGETDCNGATLAAPFGYCSVRINYTQTPATNDFVGVQIETADNSPFPNVQLDTSDLDNSCP